MDNCETMKDVFMMFKDPERMYITKAELKCCILYITGRKPSSNEVSSIWENFKKSSISGMVLAEFESLEG